MDLRVLPTFVAVADCGHFGRAAAIVNLSQPAVSYQISQLEESIGARLFNRDRHRVTLTVAGEALLEEARAILEAAARAEARLRAVTTGSVGRVRIGATATAALYVMPPLIAAFRARHPRYGCTFVAGAAGDLEDRVIRNELDMAVVAGSRPEGGLRARLLAPDRFVLVGAAPARRGRWRPADLQHAAWVLREEGSDARRLALRWLERRGLTPSQTMTLEGPAAVVEAAAAGLGLALVSERAARGAIAAGRLGAIAAPHLPARAFWLVDYPRRHHGAACQAMSALLISSGEDPRSRSQT